MKFLRNHWFLIALTLVLIAGITRPAWFRTFSDAAMLRNFIVASVLFVMALPLNTKTVRNSMLAPWPAIWASLVNMVALPLLAWALAQFLRDQWQQGLLVTAAVPCTLASAAVWTRRAGGDETVAVMVTALTNILCFVATPFWLVVTTGSQLDAQMQSQLAWMPLRLSLIVVLPMLLGQLVRLSEPVGRWATHHKPGLATYAQIGILSMVLTGAAKCGDRFATEQSFDWGPFPLMLVLVLILHLAIFALGFQSAAWLGFGRAKQIAVAIAGSQKTLMVGLDIAIQYFGGLAMLPMVTYHFTQLLADTIIADRLRIQGQNQQPHDDA